MENGKTSFDAFKESIAEKLDRAAGSIQRQTESSQSLGPYSQHASEWLHHSAQYVREFDIQQADLDLRRQIRTHPGKSLLIGLAAGLVVGILVRRM
jgi:hypothetical protein